MHPKEISVRLRARRPPHLVDLSSPEQVPDIILTVPEPLTPPLPSPHQRLAQLQEKRRIAVEKTEAARMAFLAAKKRGGGTSFMVAFGRHHMARNNMLETIAEEETLRETLVELNMR